MTADLIPFGAQQQVLPPINAETVLAVWRRLEESKLWGEPVRILQCDQRQNVVYLQGTGHETFEVVDMLEERVLTHEEFPDEWFELFTWRVIWDLEAKPPKKKARRAPRGSHRTPSVIHDEGRESESGAT
jgi:hypothetical protein